MTQIRIRNFMSASRTIEVSQPSELCKDDYCKSFFQKNKKNQ